jgi:hypothetical protein
MRRIVNACALAVAAYGFAAWAYVAANALITPWTLHLPLTHLARWPRTDTFGAACFAASFIAFVIYLLTRRSTQPRATDGTSPGVG